MEFHDHAILLFVLGYITQSPKWFHATIPMIRKLVGRYVGRKLWPQFFVYVLHSNERISQTTATRDSVIPPFPSAELFGVAFFIFFLSLASGLLCGFCLGASELVHLASYMLSLQKHWCGRELTV